MNADERNTQPPRDMNEEALALHAKIKEREAEMAGAPSPGKLTTKSSPTPAVGRDVHYWSRGSADGRFPSVARAAKITEVHYVDHDTQEYVVSLAVFNPTGLFFDTHVRMSPSGEPGHWSWPVHV